LGREGGGWVGGRERERERERQGEREGGGKRKEGRRNSADGQSQVYGLGFRV
jgi:hypothetical protein